MIPSSTSAPSFSATLRNNGFNLSRRSVRTIQVNIGKLCNQVCTHCHVDAGPNKRRENMDQKTAERVLKLIKNTPTVEELDLTGGAPELNPNFRWLIGQVRATGIKVIDRCNLTVLFEPGQNDLAQFLAINKVQIVASLPCYTPGNVDKQRGDGVFDKSIRGLQALNEQGYGQSGSDLSLNLVYNPLGPVLPPSQQKLSDDYRERLKSDFGIVFDQLYTITNMPIKRFKYDLKKQGALEGYMHLLRESFNPSTVDGLMCFSTVSVSWDGKLFDCDFNQMLDIPVATVKNTIWEINSFDDIKQTNIVTADHCFGCTAGSGSSCTGTTV